MGMGGKVDDEGRIKVEFETYAIGMHQLIWVAQAIAASHFRENELRFRVLACNRRNSSCCFQVSGETNVTQPKQPYLLSIVFSRVSASGIL